jgi:hypothetical protein
MSTVGLGMLIHSAIQYFTIVKSLVKIYNILSNSVSNRNS